MWVTKKRYEKVLGVADEAMAGWERSIELGDIERNLHAHTEQHLRSAESALAYKEDVIEELQAEVYELTCERNKWRGLYHDVDAELDTSRIVKQKQVEDAVARAEAAEKALAAATKISYVVALHERDVPAAPRFNSLDGAYTEYLDSVKPVMYDDGITATPPYRVFALRGDEVIADVTDPSTWDERLPVSEKREEPKPWSADDQIIRELFTRGDATKRWLERRGW